MRIEPQDLNSSDYILIFKLEHKAIIPFVKENLNKLTFISVFFYGTNTALLAACITIIYKQKVYLNTSIADIIAYFNSGFLFALLLIPIHELIHVLAYKFVGAKETSIDYNLKKFYFLAIANNFVVNKKEFTFVALAPFVLVTSILIASYFFVGTYWQISILSTLFLHSALCAGDFGLLNFFHISKNRNLLLFDDAKNKVSFFYGRNNN
jgi:hypothetical protein